MTKNKCMCLWNIMSPATIKSEKAIFSTFKSKSQGHNVIDLGFNWKGNISGVNMPNMKSLSLMVQKL